MQKGSRKKILMTGGHAGATGYAVIQEIEKREKNWEIYWFGARKAVEGGKTETLERKVFSQMDVKFVPILAGRIQTRFSLWTIPSLIKIPVGFIHSFIKIIKIRPDIIISFGGFVAVPVVFNAWLLGIPVVIHEQTAEVGRANLFSKRFAKKILISRSSSQKYFPRGKTIFTGNPISREIRTIRYKENKNKPPLVFVAGGSRGSVTINDCVRESLEEILKNFKLIHQTGEYQFNVFLKISKKLPFGLRKRYQALGLVEPWEWFKLVKLSDIIISRSGANMVSEVIAAKRPAIFIPLPIAYKNEQLKNAEIAVKLGIAKIIEQKELTSNKLLGELAAVNINWKRMVDSVKSVESPDFSASSLFLDEVEKILE